MGLDMIQGDHEDAPGQLELNWMFDDVLRRTATALTTYRQICAQVAREFNLIACFMSKPFMGVSASGCHHNMSLWTGGEDRRQQDLHQRSEECPACRRLLHLRRGRRPTHFMPDPSDRRQQKAGQPVGLQSIGGVIEHLGALTAIGSSTVNSYRRLWDTGFWAPVFADWGYQNRTCALRVSAPGRFEYRSVDSMVNPYLMGGGASEGLRRRHRAQPRSRRTGRAQHLRSHGSRQGRSRSCPCPSARRWTGWKQRRVVIKSLACRARCTGSLPRTTKATSGNGSCRHGDRLGSGIPTWDCLP